MSMACYPIVWNIDDTNENFHFLFLLVINYYFLFLYSASKSANGLKHGSSEELAETALIDAK